MLKSFPNNRSHLFKQPAILNTLVEWFVKAWEGNNSITNIFISFAQSTDTTQLCCEEIHFINDSFFEASFQNENTRNPIKVSSIKPLKYSLKLLVQTCYSWVIGLSHFWNASANTSQLFVPVWLLSLRKYRLTFFWQNNALWEDGKATKWFRLVRKIGKIKVQSICLFLIIYVNCICM